MTTAVLRDAHGDDLPEIARLHRSELGHGFFVALGPQFLRAYHRTFVDSPHGTALVAERDGEVVGFLVGTLDNRRHYRWVVRWRLPELVWCGAQGMVRHPRLVRVFVRTRLRRYVAAIRRRVGRGRAAAADSGPGRGAAVAAVLMHVVVDPACQGRGIGTRLTDRFLVGALAVGATEAQLVTLSGGDGAADFYRGRGWSLVGHRSDPDGLAVCVFRRSLRHRRELDSG